MAVPFLLYRKFLRDPIHSDSTGLGFPDIKNFLKKIKKVEEKERGGSL